MDFARRYSKLLPGPFQEESTTLALAILASGTRQLQHVVVGVDTLTDHDRTRIEAYSRNLVDHHLITDLLPRLAEIYFFSPMEERISLSALQQALLVGLGLQLKSVDKLSIELNLPVQQILAMLNKAIRKFSKAPSRDTSDSSAFEGAVKDLQLGVKSGTVVSVPSLLSSGDIPSKLDDKPKFAKSSTTPKTFNRRPDKKHKRG